MIVLAAVGDLLALEIHRAGIAVGQIDEAAVGMDVDRAGGLRRPHVAGLGQRGLDEQRVAREPVVGHELVDVELALALDRDEHPRLPWGFGLATPPMQSQAFD